MDTLANVTVVCTAAIFLFPCPYPHPPAADNLAANLISAAQKAWPAVAAETFKDGTNDSN